VLPAVWVSDNALTSRQLSEQGAPNVPIHRSEPCQGIVTAEDVEVRGYPTGLSEVAPIHRAEQPCIMGVLCDKAR
jgi:hypothetical protein